MDAGAITTSCLHKTTILVKICLSYNSVFQKCVTALNKTWHPEHFFCTLCGRPFGDDGFHEKDGKAYCK